MSDYRKHRPGPGSSQSGAPTHKKFKTWEGQSRFAQSGSGKSRALDKFVDRERESVKRHNRLIDLKREEEKRARKHSKRTEEDDLPPPVQFKFGKESVADEGYSELRTETLASRKQQEREKLEAKKIAAEEKKAREQKKRKRVDFGDESDSDSDEEDKPPKKVAKDGKEEEDASNAKKNGEDVKGAAGEGAQGEGAKKAGKPARSFQEARARYEETQRLKREKQDAFERRQLEIAQKQEQAKKTSAKLRQRTSRGQPIMKNMLSHMMNKFGKQNAPGSK